MDKRDSTIKIKSSPIGYLTNNLQKLVGPILYLIFCRHYKDSFESVSAIWFYSFPPWGTQRIHEYFHASGGTILQISSRPSSKRFGYITLR